MARRRIPWKTGLLGTILAVWRPIKTLLGLPGNIEDARTWGGWIREAAAYADNAAPWIGIGLLLVLVVLYFSRSGRVAGDSGLLILQPEPDGRWLSERETNEYVRRVLLNNRLPFVADHDMKVILSGAIKDGLRARYRPTSIHPWDPITQDEAERAFDIQERNSSAFPRPEMHFEREYWSDDVYEHWPISG